MMGEVAAESPGVLVAEEGGEAVQLGRLGGQDLGLLVVDHLQPVLDLPQEAVGQLQVVRDLAADPAGIDQGGQRVLCAAYPQPGVAAAPDQLLGLGKELDLADAAAPELDEIGRASGRERVCPYV